jgi:hypothetical protein
MLETCRRTVDVIVTGDDDDDAAIFAWLVFKRQRGARDLEPEFIA